MIRDTGGVLEKCLFLYLSEFMWVISLPHCLRTVTIFGRCCLPDNRGITTQLNTDRTGAESPLFKSRGLPMDFGAALPPACKCMGLVDGSIGGAPEHGRKLVGAYIRRGIHIHCEVRCWKPSKSKSKTGQGACQNIQYNT